MTIKCPKCQHENPDDTIYCGKCTTPLKPSEDIEVTATIEAPKEELTTGSTFANRYQIIEEIGKGGMGRVYKVEDTKIKEKIALKLIKPEIAKDKKTIERFNNELRLARKVRHKNVCQMFDLGEEKGTQFITMEYVSGEDLRSSIRRFGQLPIGKSISIAHQICEGLAEAHRADVVHRDLKSNNIMIDKEGNVRIMDFGIARSLESKGITGAGVMIGTPEYMSPEQVEGKETDQRSDIYSLGVILYEMVTGRVPFEGDTPFTVGVKQKSEVPQNPKDINSQIPDSLNNVILKCLEKEKDKRFQSAGEVRSELENIEKGMPTTERIIPERKPLTSREITVQFSVKKLFIPVLIGIAIIIAPILIWQLLPQKEAISVPTGRPILAVMYFENNTGDENLDHWRKMIPSLIIDDLTQSKFIDVLSREKLFTILSDLNQVDAQSYSSDVLKQVAVKGRVNHILVGNYAKAGESIRINVTLQDSRTEKTVGSEGVEGKGEDSLFPMVDELTRKIKTNLKLTDEEIASDIDRDVGEITTSSPEAYKYYIEGRDYHNRAESRESIQSMEKAVAIDPEFAMAYRSMAMTYFNMTYFSASKKYLKKAFELTDRLSDREKFLIQAEFYRGSERTFDKAIEAYNKLLELYPTDFIGNVNYGILYLDLEEWDKAIELFEVPIHYQDDTYFPYFNMAYAYRAKGLYGEAQEMLEYYLDNISDNPIIRWALALNYLSQGKNDLALVELDRAMSFFPHWYFIFTKGDLHLYTGDLTKAENEYQKLLETPETASQIVGRQRLAALYILQGGFNKAIGQLKQVIKNAEDIGEMSHKSTGYLGMAETYLKARNPEDALNELENVWIIATEEELLSVQRMTLLRKTLAYLEMKLQGDAQKVMDELEDSIRKGKNQKLMRYLYLLKGIIELERESYSSAIEEFEKAKSLLPYQSDSIYGEDHAIFFDSLASANYKAGEIEKAREEYEKITELTTGRIWDGDIYAKSFYMLGKIYEDQGKTAKAIEHYEKFLDLWKDADPGFPEVDDARTRLSNIKG
ncbi:MAG: protein kinase [Candidatus Aminicenantes bacterium]|nr:MAG: protein kinase [Candidatus Aminicenantes bacterium]